MYKNNYLDSWKKNKEKLIENNVYREEDEHSSCGVGLIASISGRVALALSPSIFVFSGTCLQP